MNYSTPTIHCHSCPENSFLIAIEIFSDFLCCCDPLLLWFSLIESFGFCGSCSHSSSLCTLWVVPTQRCASTREKCNRNISSYTSFKELHSNNTDIVCCVTQKNQVLTKFPTYCAGRAWIAAIWGKPRVSVTGAECLETRKKWKIIELSREKTLANKKS